LKILVTGGAGFIGSHIVDALVAKGHEVSIVDSLLMGRRENLNPAAKFYLMDIRAREVDRLFEIEKFEAVFHLAAQMDVRKSVEDPMFDADVNVIGTLNLLTNCVKAGTKKVVFASSGGAVYGEQEEFPCGEDHPTRPVSPYGITKLCVEKYLFYFSNEFGLRYTALRFANVYGPRQNPHGEAGVVAIFTSRLLAGQPCVINGDGGQTRDYVYVGDVADANLRALSHPENGAFNVGTGVESDVNRIYRLLNTSTGAKADEKHGPAKPGEQRRSVIRFDKAKAELGWSPKVPLEEGLKRTVDYFRSKA
jgi:UDP-glucose 4-epimerase